MYNLLYLTVFYAIIEDWARILKISELQRAKKTTTKAPTARRYEYQPTVGRDKRFQTGLWVKIPKLCSSNLEPILDMTETGRHQNQRLVRQRANERVVLGPTAEPALRTAGGKWADPDSQPTESKSAGGVGAGGKQPAWFVFTANGKQITERWRGQQQSQRLEWKQSNERGQIHSR